MTPRASGFNKLEVVSIIASENLENIDCLACQLWHAQGSFKQLRMDAVGQPRPQMTFAANVIADGNTRLGQETPPNENPRQFPAGGYLVSQRRTYAIKERGRGGR